MIDCKKFIIVTGFLSLWPMMSWSEAPVVDDSENFAIISGQQDQGPVASKYDQRQIENAPNDGFSSPADDGPALVQDDGASDANNSAQLIDKIINLQKEVQELRGQLEVQAHDLKTLQQQQLSFYKDLDSRLSGTAGKTVKNYPNGFGIRPTLCTGYTTCQDKACSCSSGISC